MFCAESQNKMETVPVIFNAAETCRLACICVHKIYQVLKTFQTYTALHINTFLSLELGAGWNFYKCKTRL